MAVKTDCAAWDKENRDCMALKEIVCVAKKCPFYKTAARVEEDAEREKRRLERTTGVAAGTDEMPMRELMRLGEIPRKPPKPEKHPYVTNKSELQKKADRCAYQKERRRRMIAEGICPICGKTNDRPGKTLCASCAARENAKRTKRNRGKSGISV